MIFLFKLLRTFFFRYLIERPSSSNQLRFTKQCLAIRERLEMSCRLDQFKNLKSLTVNKRPA